MTRTAKMCFTAEVDDESEEVSMTVEWDTSIKIAVQVLYAAAIKHHQIRSTIEMVCEVLEKEAPLTDEERKNRMLKVMFNSMFEDDPDAQAALQQMMANQQPKGDA
jgi:hypothetical protein